ncbi:hypothetical protein [Burkholderia sp. Ac-20353]|uniref:hypothetical protein n=1 Tax=Burkholderia sp. Ac-20353 TaxID=2703894 RepID=UPI00197BA4CC|nr:hypothetical protein [Burkholderia sp. Ac-20353]MBN3787647.1 hypothetical protein [Burkholderia sp. Ac-20353]
MKKHRIACLLVAMLSLPAIAPAEVNLTGKVTSKVTATVVKMFQFDVTDDKGGWFDQGLEMQQLGGWDTPYEVKARLRVLSTSRDFQVRLDEPLVIRNQSNAAQVFRQPAVSLGAEDGAPKPLVVGQSTGFQNPAPVVSTEDSVGFYTLSVAAYPPEGDFKSTVGTYSGTLSMTFEPVVKAP